MKPLLAQVACEYRHQTGEDPPHRNLGLPSLTALLRTLPPTVCRLEQAPGWVSDQGFILTSLYRGGVMVHRGGRGWQEGGGGKGGGHHDVGGRGGGGQGRSRRNQGPKQPGRRPREKSMAWVPPTSAR